MEGTIPGPALHYSFGCVSRQKRKCRCVPRAAWHLEGALGSIIFQRDAGKRTKHGVVQKPQTCNLSKSQRRPVHPPSPAHTAPKSLVLLEAGRAWFSDHSQKGKTDLLCLVSIDSTQRLTAKDSMTHHINHRLNVIMRSGQAVKTGFQIPVTASSLKIWT